MPIFPNATQIPINHPIFGMGDLPSRLGTMSTELAMWLKSKTDYEQILASGDDQDIDLAKKGQLRLKDSKLHNWNMRCLLASTREYSPQLSDELGNLTPTGQALGQVLQFEFKKHQRELADQKYLLPEAWTKTDQVIIHGLITIRQAAMLKIVHLACLEAEHTKREELDEEYKSARTIARREEESQASAKRRVMQDLHLPTESGKSEEPGKTDRNEKTNKLVTNSMEQVLDVLFEKASHNTPQSLQARLVGGYGPDRQAYVPTAMFGQRARNDLHNLVKYGLVDLKALASGVRGRPKHIIRTSTPGLVVVTDLSELGII